MSEFTLKQIGTPPVGQTAAQAKSGMAFEPAMLVGLYSPDQWERFTEEWLQAFKNDFAMIRRLSGPGDRGLDVLAFTDLAAFDAPWRSFQCKRYGGPLSPSDLWIELGKIIYFSFIKASPFDGTHCLPDRHIFVAPKDVGLTAQKLLLNPASLKKGMIENWAKYCATGLGKDISAPLTGPLADYVAAFDFAIFGYKSVVEVIAEHKTTQYHVTRFGSAFPPKPAATPAPAQPASNEAVYVRKLLDAYGDNQRTTFNTLADLAPKDALTRHLRRQRELFYDAECLRGFARDTVPEGVFEGLSDDIFHAVIDIVESDHACGFERVKAVVTQAAIVDVSGNALSSVSTVRERQGICHQLANDDRLTWVK